MEAHEATGYPFADIGVSKWMSALPSKAGIGGRQKHVRFGPEADHPSRDRGASTNQSTLPLNFARLDNSGAPPGWKSRRNYFQKAVSLI
jgi:hypothetical protein